VLGSSQAVETAQDPQIHWYKGLRFNAGAFATIMFSASSTPLFL
jgi:hypothetical protein